MYILILEDCQGKWIKQPVSSVFHLKHLRVVYLQTRMWRNPNSWQNGWRVMGSKTKQQQHKDREIPHNVCLLTGNGAEWLFGNYFWFLCFSLKVNLLFFHDARPKIKVVLCFFSLSPWVCIWVLYPAMPWQFMLNFFE